MPATVLEEDASVARGYLRALLHARRAVRAAEAPEIAFERRGVRIDPAWLAELKGLFGAPHAAGVPLSLPHVLAGAMQLRVLTDERFPLRILGAVHVRSKMAQLGEIDAGARYTLRVSLGELRDVEKGTEHDLLTELLEEGGEVCWRGVSTNLTLDPRAPRRSKKVPRALPTAENETTFEAPRGIGRRYGRVSGDRNPIHLSRYTARLFGFKRAIAHGMWTVGRALVLLGHPEGRPGDELEVRFKRPLLLPGRVSLRWGEREGAIGFWVVDPPREQVHVEGQLRSV